MALEIQLLVERAVAIQAGASRGNFMAIHRACKIRCHEDQEFDLVLHFAVGTEQSSEIRNIGQSWQANRLRFRSHLEQASQGKRLSGFQFHRRFHKAAFDTGNAYAINCDCASGIDFANCWSYFQIDTAFATHLGDEIDSCPVLFKLDSN